MQEKIKRLLKGRRKVIVAPPSFVYQRMVVGDIFVEPGKEICVGIEALSTLPSSKRLEDPLNFCCVLRTGDNIYRRRIALGIFIPQNAIEDAVFFGLLGKLL